MNGCMTKTEIKSVTRKNVSPGIDKIIRLFETVEEDSNVDGKESTKKEKYEKKRKYRAV